MPENDFSTDKSLLEERMPSFRLESTRVGSKYF